MGFIMVRHEEDNVFFFFFFESKGYLCMYGCSCVCYTWVRFIDKGLESPWCYIYSIIEYIQS